MSAVKADKRDKRLRNIDDEVIEAPINPQYIRRLFRYAKPYGKDLPRGVGDAAGLCLGAGHAAHRADRAG